MKVLCLIAVAACCGLNVNAQTNMIASTNSTPAAPKPPTRIFADSAVFDMNTNRATYSGHVRVNDPEMKMTCELLIADLPAPQSGGHISHIVCETNVVIDFTNDQGQTNHVTADKAVYNYAVQGSVTNETVTFTGHPRIENAQYTINSEPIVWDRAKNQFQFTEPKMISHQSLNLVPAKTNSPSVNTNKMSAPK